MKPKGTAVVSISLFFIGLMAGAIALAAQQTAGASAQASSAVSGQAQAAVALVLKQYIINPDVKVVGTKKPLPKDGTWGARQAHGTEGVADCEIAGSVCLEVVYRAGQPEVSCGWTVLFPASGAEARVVNMNEAAALYMLRYFAADDQDIPKKIKGDLPDMPPIAKVAHMTGTVVLRTVVDATGKVQSLSVVSSTNPMFNNYAIVGVMKWQMGAFTLNGRVLPYQENLSIGFQ